MNPLFGMLLENDQHAGCRCVALIGQQFFSFALGSHRGGSGAHVEARCTIDTRIRVHQLRLCVSLGLPRGARAWTILRLKQG